MRVGCKLWMNRKSANTGKTLPYNQINRNPTATAADIRPIYRPVLATGHSSIAMAHPPCSRRNRLQHPHRRDRSREAISHGFAPGRLCLFTM